MTDRFAALSIFACLAFAIIAFVVVVFGVGADNAFIHSYDVREDFIYKREFLRTTLQAGHLPLWNPHTFGGAPFLANPQANVFYPGVLLFLWLPHSLIIELIAHLLLAAAGTYALARVSYDVARGPAALAALTFCLSGTFFGHVFRGHPHIINAIAWIPWLALAIDQAAARLSRQRDTSRMPAHATLRDAVRTARNTLASVGAWPFFAALALGLQLLTGSLQITWLGLLFIGLSRFLRLVMARHWTLRAWYHEALLLSAVTLLGTGLAAIQLLPTWELSQLSTRAAQDYIYVTTGSYLPAQSLTIVDPRAETGGELAPGGNFGYAGLLAVMLACLSLFFSRGRCRIVILWVSAVFFFLFMLGNNAFLFPLLYKYVPSFDLFRAPARAMTIFHLIVALLAALGLDGIFRKLQARSGMRSWIAPGLMLAICAMTWVDLVSAARWQEKALVFAEMESLEDPAQITHARMLERDESWYRYWFFPNALRDNHAFAVNARSVAGYDVMILSRYEKFVRFMTNSETARPGITRLSAASYLNSPSPFPFKVLGVKYADFGERLLARSDETSLSRAWFVSRARELPDEESALRYMRGATFGPFDEVVFETDEANRPGGLATESTKDAGYRQLRIKVEESRPERLVMRIGPHPAGYLVLSEIYYPGWTATISGNEMPIYRCNSILRCLQLEGSETPLEISMAFQPASLRWGALISAVTLCLLGVGFWLLRHRSQPD